MWGDSVSANHKKAPTQQKKAQEHFIFFRQLYVQPMFIKSNSIQFLTLLRFFLLLKCLFRDKIKDMEMLNCFYPEIIFL